MQAWVQQTNQRLATVVTTAATADTGQDSPVRDRLRRAVAQLDEAERVGRPEDLINALLPLARCYVSMHRFTAADETLRQAQRAARSIGGGQQLIRVLTERAYAASRHAQDLREHDASEARVYRDRARDCAFEVAAQIQRNQQADWAAAALVAISDVLDACGDHDDAAAMRLRAEAWRSAH